MFDRVGFKEAAKEDLKAHYWWYVLASFVMGFLGISLGNNGFSGGGSSGGSAANGAGSAGGSSGSADSELIAWILAIIGIVILISIALCVFAVVIRVFVLNHIMVGANRYLRERRAGEPDFIKTFFCTFRKSSYWNVTKAVFLKDLYVFLWSLLFIIPGIVASYRYRLVAPILAENPELPASEALRLSAEMMDGNKMEAFIMDLSFIGWNLLAIIPLVGWFWVNPYIRLTNVEMYDALAQPYRMNGRLYQIG